MKKKARYARGFVVTVSMIEAAACQSPGPAAHAPTAPVPPMDSAPLVSPDADPNAPPAPPPVPVDVSDPGPSRRLNPLDRGTGLHVVRRSDGCGVWVPDTSGKPRPTGPAIDFQPVQ